MWFCSRDKAESKTSWKGWDVGAMGGRGRVLFLMGIETDLRSRLCLSSWHTLSSFIAIRLKKYGR